MAITTTTTHRVEVPDTDLTFEAEGPIPDAYDDDIWVRNLTGQKDGSTRAVTWLVSDQEDRSDLIEWDDPSDDPREWVNGCFRDFRNSRDGGGEVARDDFMAEAIEAVGADHVFVVDVYSHGLEHYSVANTVPYPDRQWDVAPACVLVVPADVTSPREWAVAMMESWTAVVNGDVWGIVTHYLDDAGNVVECDSVWGMIGREWAEQAAASGDY